MGVFKVIRHTNANPEYLYRAVNYVTHGHTDSDNIGSLNTDIHNACSQMYTVKQYFSKTGGNLLFHFVVSYNTRTAYDEERAKYLSAKIAEYFADRYQIIWCVHEEKTAEYEELVRTVWQLKAKDSQYRTVYFPAGTSVCIGIKACYPIPKNTGRVKREKMLSGEIKPIKPLVKPDLDNIGKIVCDALNGIAYADDKQIAEMWIQKWYSENPRVEITVMDSGSENVR